MNTPYSRDEQIINSPDLPSRNNLHTKRPDSGDKLEEWSQIFSLQHSRWQDEFDSLKARFRDDFEKQKSKEKVRDDGHRS